MLFRRFLPGKHQAIFATIVAKLPPVVVVDFDDAEHEGEDEDGGGGQAVVVASERAYAKLSSRRSDNERR